MNRKDLQPYMVIETALRGEEDLGKVIDKKGILYARFKDCEFQINSMFIYKMININLLEAIIAIKIRIFSKAQCKNIH